MTRRRTWWRLTLAGVILAALALPSPAGAGAPAVNLAPPTGPPGTAVVATGSGFLPGLDVYIRWGPLPGIVVGGPVAAGPTGNVTIPFNVPGDATPGPHPVTMCTGGSGPTGCGPEVATAPFVVTAPATPPPATPPPSPTATPSPTPSPSPTPTPTPTVPIPTFPVGAETPEPTPELPPLVAVTPAPTPPADLAVPEEEFPDLWVKAIEVTQGLQDLRNRMPLVEGRRTYARVYVGSIGQPEWAPTEGALEARRNGQQIGWIWSENGPITAKLGAGSRVEADDSLNFRLPQDWLHGEVTLTAFVYSFQVSTVFELEPESENNFMSETVTFHPGRPLTVHLAPLHMHRSFHPDDVERTYAHDLDGDFISAGGSSTLRTINGLLRFHPLAQIGYDLFTGPVVPIGHSGGHEFNMGDCPTVLLEAIAHNHIRVLDWEPLMEDPDAVDDPEVGSFEPDRSTVRLLDDEFEIDYWYLSEDGVELFGSMLGGGSLPLPGTPVFVDGCRPSPTSEAEPNQTLSLYQVFYDWEGEEDLFVGMVHPSLPTYFAGLSTGGTDSVWVRMNDSFSATSPWSHGSAGTLGHEAAHAAGLKHVACADGDDDGVPDELKGGSTDASHPNEATFPNCSLADVDPEGYYGFDVYWTHFGQSGPTAISNNPDEDTPNRAFPLMSYASPKWSDPYHHCRLLDYYGVPCDPTDLGIPWSEPNAAAGGPLTAPLDPTHDELPPGTTALLGLRGTIDPAAGTGTLEGAYYLDEPTDAAMDRYAGQYVVADVQHRLTVLDPTGVELASVPIQQQSGAHAELSEISFEILVPVFPDASVYQLNVTDQAFIRLPVSPEPFEPVTITVETVEPAAGGRIKFAWFSAEESSFVSTSTVLYSPDGEHWQVLGVGLTETSFEVDPATLPAGDAPVLKVIVFDGTRAAIAVSEPIEGVTGLPPLVVADAPAGFTYPLGADVVLRASAWDPEDRNLPGDAIEWTSSLDGALGAGSELIAGALTGGVHQITATASDSDGLTDEATFELTVDPDVVEADADPELEATVGEIFAALAAGEDPSTVVSRGPDEAVLAIVLLGVGVLLIGGTLLVWARRRRAATPA
jgi:hypothetical protein